MFIWFVCVRTYEFGTLTKVHVLSDVECRSLAVRLTGKFLEILFVDKGQFSDVHCPVSGLILFC